MNRRYFLMSSAAIGLGTRASTLASPNDTIRVGCIGVRNQGRNHIRRFAKVPSSWTGPMTTGSNRPNVEIAALCDVDESVLAERAKDVEAMGGKRPALFTDARKLFEDKSIDVVGIATPNHTHALLTIWACQAGKDVYVEKPCTYNIYEARQIVAAARKYNRLVQHGTQSRSSQSLHEAAQKLRGGVIGDVYMGRGICFRWRAPIGHTSDEAVPAGVHYDLWLGPAPQRPFNRNHFHYNWHWNWTYGGGEIGNQGIHEVDTCRWMLGVKYPVMVSSMGGHFMYDDDQQTPNTQVSLFEFEDGGKKKLMEFEVRHAYTHPETKISHQGTLYSTGTTFYGSKGYMALGPYSYETFLGREQEPGPKAHDSGDHYANFLQAVRSRKASELNAEVEEGATSTVLIHLANISYRLRRTLRFDPQTLTCIGDAEANRMLTRNYRPPFVVPAKV